MKKLLAVVLAAIFVFSAMAYCMAAGSEPIRQPNNVKQVPVKSETITVDSGKNFEIKMDTNPSTGYSWKISKVDEKIVKFVKKSFIPPKDGRPGQGGLETWVFQALAKGKTTMTMDYERTWEKGKPAKTVNYEIIVK